MITPDPRITVLFRTDPFDAAHRADAAAAGYAQGGRLAAVVGGWLDARDTLVPDVDVEDLAARFAALACSSRTLGNDGAAAAAEAGYAQGLALAATVGAWLESRHTLLPEVDVEDWRRASRSRRCARPSGRMWRISRWAPGTCDRYGAADALARLRDGIRRLNVSIGGANTPAPAITRRSPRPTSRCSPLFSTRVRRACRWPTRVARLLDQPAGRARYALHVLLARAAVVDRRPVRDGWIPTSRRCGSTPSWDARKLPMRGEALMRIRTLAATIAAIVVLGAALAQSPAPALLDARASDPVAMGWMAGSPPPAAKVIRFADGSYYKFPQTRWAFSHMRELVPTVAGLARQRRRCRRCRAPSGADLDAVTFTPIGGSARR